MQAEFGRGTDGQTLRPNEECNLKHLLTRLVTGNAIEPGVAVGRPRLPTAARQPTSLWKIHPDVPYLTNLRL